MKDVYSIIQQLADQHLKELRPIDYILDYYTNPMKGFIDPRDKKEFVIEWKDEDGRITEIQRYNTIINGYNAEVKNNEKEFNKLLPPGDKVYSSSDLGYNKPLDYFDTIPFWAFNCISKLSRNITVNDKELYKLLYNELKDKNQFVQYLNKEIFNYIQSEIRKAKDLEAWDSDNMWYEPNKRFVKWFQIKNIDSTSDKSGLPPIIAKWAKEVVSILKEHGEMKNIDIILALDEKGMTASYKHISQIFKSESDRNFYKEELMNNGSYFSIKPTK